MARNKKFLPVSSASYYAHYARPCYGLPFLAKYFRIHKTPVRVFVFCHLQDCKVSAAAFSSRIFNFFLYRHMTKSD